MTKVHKSESKSKDIVIGKSFKKSKDKQKKNELIKDLVVTVHKMTPSEIKLHTEADSVIVKNMNISICKGVLSIGNEQIQSSTKVFDIKLKLNSSETIVKLETASEPESLSNSSNKIVERVTASKKPASSCMSTVKTLDSLIKSAWTRCKKDSKENNQAIVVGDIVLAKMVGYSPWPSRITYRRVFQKQ